jgi:hypothetical protein
VGREWLVQRTSPKYVYRSLLLIEKGPLVEQRRHGYGAAGRYEMSPIDAEAAVPEIVL